MMEMMLGRTANYTGVLLRSFTGINTARTTIGVRCLCQCDFTRWNSRLCGR